MRDSGIGVNLIIGGENAKRYFHILFAEKDVIDNAIGLALQWRELPQYKESQVYAGPRPADFSQHGRWPEYYAWIADTIDAYSRIFGPRIRQLRPDQPAPTRQDSEVASPVAENSSAAK